MQLLLALMVNLYLLGSFFLADVDFVPMVVKRRLLAKRDKVEMVQVEVEMFALARDTLAEEFASSATGTCSSDTS